MSMPAMADPSSTVSPAAVKACLATLYAGAPLKQRLMAAGRPYIAPLELVLSEIPKNARHLDMGCGAGFLLGLSASLRETTSLVGVDVDPRALSVAAAVTSGLAGKADVRLLTYDAWTGDAERDFDVVTLVDVLHHVPMAMRPAFLENLLGRVRPGGLFVYKDMARTPRISAFANYMHDLVLTGERVTLTPVAEVEAVAAANGFELLRSDKMFRLWYAHELRVFRRS